MRDVPLAEDERGLSHAIELSLIVRSLNKRKEERENEKKNNQRGYLVRFFYSSRRERLTIIKIISFFFQLVYNTTAVLLVFSTFALLTVFAGFIIRELLY